MLINKKKIVLFFIAIFLSLPFLSISSSLGVDIHTSEVKMLLLIDDDFGENYLMIRSKMLGFGWDVTIAGPNSNVSSCPPSGAYLFFDVDILYSEITNITSYNCITILPGRDHKNLLANKDNILDLIKDASDAGVIIAGWCRSVRVLAKANVISGKNVTGNDMFADEYEAAGATFIPNSPPIISSNIVTSIRSLYYQNAMLLACAEAIGCYECNAPSLLNPKITRCENGCVIFNIQIFDESNVLTALAYFTYLDDLEENALQSSSFTKKLLSEDNNDEYACVLPSDIFGNYNVTISVSDVFWNEQVYVNFTNISISTNKAGINIASINLLSVLIVMVFIVKRKKLN